MTDPVVEIRDLPEEGAYVVEVDGQRAGMAFYQVRGDGPKVFVHTEIADEFAGMGLGTRLVRFALDDVREQGDKMVPICPFFAAYVDRHPEYKDIVDTELTARLNARRR